MVSEDFFRFYLEQHALPKTFSQFQISVSVFTLLAIFHMKKHLFLIEFFGERCFW